MENLLVEYKGGGFEGCWWQWNYFAWDCDGKFHNILLTGYKGVKDEAEAIDLLNHIGDDRRDPEVLDLTDRAAIIAFVNNGNASRMSHIANHHWYFGEVMYGTCQHCGEIAPVVNMFPGDESGDGGIAISAKNLYCESCFYMAQENTATLLIGDRVKIQIGDVSQWKGGRAYYSYVMYLDGELLFSGDDFSPPPMDDPYSLDSLVSLLGFLVLKPGDTDDEYFLEYTEAQLDFAKSSFCEDLSLIPYDHESGEFENWDVTESYDDWGNPVWEVAYE